MKVFIISLRQETTRRAALIAQCQELGIDFELFDATDGQNLPALWLQDFVYNYPACALTPGEIGCAMSHQRVYQRIISQNLSHALILEDDAILPDNIARTLAMVEHQIMPQEVITLLLTAPHVYLAGKKRTLPEINFYAIQYASSAMGYIVTREAARKLITINHTLRWEADRWEIFRHYYGLPVYCAVPHLINSADEHKSTSALETEREMAKTARGKRLTKQKRRLPWYLVKRIKRILLAKWLRATSYPPASSS